MPFADPAASGLDEAVVLEDPCHRGNRGQLPAGIIPVNDGEQLLWAPMGVFAAALQNGGNDLVGNAGRGGYRPSGEVLEGLDGLGLLPSADPFVSGLPADPIAPTELGKIEIPCLVFLDELILVVHRLHSMPRHIRSSEYSSERICLIKKV